MKNEDTYKEVRVYDFPQATVRVFIPDLTDEEREKRMKAIREAAIALLLQVKD